MKTHDAQRWYKIKLVRSSILGDAQHEAYVCEIIRARLVWKKKAVDFHLVKYLNYYGGNISIHLDGGSILGGTTREVKGEFTFRMKGVAGEQTLVWSKIRNLWRLEK